MYYYYYHWSLINGHLYEIAWSLFQYFNVRTDVPDLVVFEADANDDEVTLKWKEPGNNGAAITQYSIYQRVVNDEQWTMVAVINDVSKREFVVTVEKGKKYEFVVTATNKYGESLKNKNLIETVNTKEGT